MVRPKYETVDERILSNIVRLAAQMVSKPEYIRRTYLRHAIGTVSAKQLDEVIKRHKIRSREGDWGVVSYNVDDAAEALTKILDARLEKKRK